MRVRMILYARTTGRIRSAITLNKIRVAQMIQDYPSAYIVDGIMPTRKFLQPCDNNEFIQAFARKIYRLWLKIEVDQCRSNIFSQKIVKIFGQNVFRTYVEW